MGLLGGLVGTGAAIYNVASGTDLETAGGAQLAFTWVVVAGFELLAAGVVTALDATFRVIQRAMKSVR